MLQYVFIYENIHYVCICIQIIYMYIDICIDIHIFAHTYLYAYICMYVCIHIHQKGNLKRKEIPEK